MQYRHRVYVLQFYNQNKINKQKKKHYYCIAKLLYKSVYFVLVLLWIKMLS